MLIDAGTDLDLCYYKTRPIISDYYKIALEFRSQVENLLSEDTDNDQSRMNEIALHISSAQRQLQYKKIISKYPAEEQGRISITLLAFENGIHLG